MLTLLKKRRLREIVLRTYDIMNLKGDISTDKIMDKLLDEVQNMINREGLNSKFCEDLKKSNLKIVISCSKYYHDNYNSIYRCCECRCYTKVFGWIWRTSKIKDESEEFTKSNQNAENLKQNRVRLSKKESIVFLRVTNK